MEDTHGIDDSAPVSPEVFTLPGEPAIVIIGVPDVPVSDGNPRSRTMSETTNDTETSKKRGFGEWVEGREVRKLFGERYYCGTVTEYDNETGWYRVVYEDGDFEDLEWHELQEVIEPLDITLPLKSLALKMIRKSEKSKHGSAERKYGARRGRPRGSSSKGPVSRG